MNLPRRAAAATIGIFILASCASERITTPRYVQPSRLMADFISAEGLPSPRPATVVFQDGEVEIVRACYGLPHDCLSGCFYSSAYGLKTQARVGWLVVYDYADGFAPDSTHFFDVTAADSAFCRDEVWVSMRGTAGGEGWFWSGFMPLLARDPDTDPRALMRIAHMLYTRVSGYVAWRLLDNPYVQHDLAILRVLEALPVFPGDPYAAQRTRAQQLDKELGLAGRPAGL
jgi:hypothetical protein